MDVSNLLSLLKRPVEGSKFDSRVSWCGRVDCFERERRFPEVADNNPWAFVRVSNEIRTLESSLTQIKKLFRRGVIGFNDCTDGTGELVRDFCARNPSFICAPYPYEVVKANSSELREPGSVPYERTLASYYNFVLSYIPEGDWLCKIDCDHYYFEDLMQFYLTRQMCDDEVFAFPRLDCLIKDENGKRKVVPYRLVSENDHWMIKNKGLQFVNVVTSDGAWELLKWSGQRRFYTTELTSYHFPLEKTRRRHLNPEGQREWDEFIQMLPDGVLDSRYANYSVVERAISNFRNV